MHELRMIADSGTRHFNREDMFSSLPARGMSVTARNLLRDCAREKQILYVKKIARSAEPSGFNPSFLILSS